MENLIVKLDEKDKDAPTINIAGLLNKPEEEISFPIVTDSGNDKKKSKKFGSSTDTINMNKAKSDNEFYDRYSKTNALLNQTIYEVDELNTIVKSELKSMAKSKTIKKKYEYISELAGTSGSLLSTKVTAIRELNKSINDSANLEIKMAKQLNEDNDNDDKKIMDMYNAFINTPVGAYAGPSAPTNSEILLGNTGITMTSPISEEEEFNKYMNNLSPEERRIHMENKNIETVVVYDPETGDRYFDNMNLDTGESVPGLPLPEAQFIDRINLNVKTGIAKNTDLNLSYKIVIKSSVPSFDGF